MPEEKRNLILSPLMQSQRKLWVSVHSKVLKWHRKMPALNVWGPHTHCVHRGELGRLGETVDHLSGRKLGLVSPQEAPPAYKLEGRKGRESHVARWAEKAIPPGGTVVTTLQMPSRRGRGLARQGIPFPGFFSQGPWRPPSGAGVVRCGVLDPSSIEQPP